MYQQNVWRTNAATGESFNTVFEFDLISVWQTIRFIVCSASISHNSRSLQVRALLQLNNRLLLTHAAQAGPRPRLRAYPARLCLAALPDRLRRQRHLQVGAHWPSLVT